MYNKDYFVWHMFRRAVGIIIMRTLMEVFRRWLMEQPFMKWFGKEKGNAVMYIYRKYYIVIRLFIILF